MNNRRCSTDTPAHEAAFQAYVSGVRANEALFRDCCCISEGPTRSHLALLQVLSLTLLQVHTCA